MSAVRLIVPDASIVSLFNNVTEITPVSEPSLLSGVYLYHPFMVEGREENEVPSL